MEEVVLGDVMIIRPDIRKFEDCSEIQGNCRKCGRPMVLLPDDMRLGYCFDCIDFLEISRKQEINEGRIFTVNLLAD
jgi:hypothetical protein